MTELKVKTDFNGRMSLGIRHFQLLNRYLGINKVDLQIAGIRTDDDNILYGESLEALWAMPDPDLDNIVSLEDELRAKNLFNNWIVPNRDSKCTMSIDWNQLSKGKSVDHYGSKNSFNFNTGINGCGFPKDQTITPFESLTDNDLWPNNGAPTEQQWQQINDIVDKTTIKRGKKNNNKNKNKSKNNSKNNQTPKISSKNIKRNENNNDTNNNSNSNNSEEPGELSFGGTDIHVINEDMPILENDTNAIQNVRYDTNVINNSNVTNEEKRDSASETEESFESNDSSPEPSVNNCYKRLQVFVCGDDSFLNIEKKDLMLEDIREFLEEKIPIIKNQKLTLFSEPQTKNQDTWSYLEPFRNYIGTKRNIWFMSHDQAVETGAHICDNIEWYKSRIPKSNLSQKTKEKFEKIQDPHKQQRFIKELQSSHEMEFITKRKNGDEIFCELVGWLNSINQFPFETRKEHSNPTKIDRNTKINVMDEIIVTGHDMINLSPTLRLHYLGSNSATKQMLLYHKEDLEAEPLIISKDTMDTWDWRLASYVIEAKRWNKYKKKDLVFINGTKHYYWVDWDDDKQMVFIDENYENYYARSKDKRGIFILPSILQWIPNVDYTNVSIFKQEVFVGDKIRKGTRKGEIVEWDPNDCSVTIKWSSNPKSQTIRIDRPTSWKYKFTNRIKPQTKILDCEFNNCLLLKYQLANYQGDKQSIVLFWTILSSIYSNPMVKNAAELSELIPENIEEIKENDRFKLPQGGISTNIVCAYKIETSTWSCTQLSQLEMSDPKKLWETRLIGNLSTLLPLNLQQPHLQTQTKMTNWEPSKSIIPIIEWARERSIIEEILKHWVRKKKKDLEILNENQMKESKNQYTEYALSQIPRKMWQDLIRIQQQNEERVLENDQALNHHDEEFQSRQGWDYGRLLFGPNSAKCGMLAAQPRDLTLKHGLFESALELRDSYDAAFLHQAMVTGNFNYLYHRNQQMQKLILSLKSTQKDWHLLFVDSFTRSDLATIENMLVIMVQFLYLHDVSKKIFTGNTQIIPMEGWLCFYEEQYMSKKNLVREQMRYFYGNNDKKSPASLILRDWGKPKPTTPITTTQVKQETTQNDKTNIMIKQEPNDGEDVQYLKTITRETRQPLSVARSVLTDANLTTALTGMPICNKISDALTRWDYQSIDSGNLNKDVQKHTDCALWYKQLKDNMGWKEADFKNLEKILNTTIKTPTFQNMNNKRMTQNWLQVVIVLFFLKWVYQMFIVYLEHQPRSNTLQHIKLSDDDIDITIEDMYESIRAITGEDVSIWKKMRDEIVYQREQYQCDEWFNYTRAGQRALIIKKNSVIRNENNKSKLQKTPETGSVDIEMVNDKSQGLYFFVTLRFDCNIHFGMCSYI